MYSCILQTKKRCKCEFKLQIKEWKKKKMYYIVNIFIIQAFPTLSSINVGTIKPC